MGVRCPAASVKSVSRIDELADRLGLAHRLVRVVDGALDLGAHVGVLRGRVDVQSVGLPLFASQVGSISASRVTRPPMNGRWSPTTMHWRDEHVRPQPVLEHRRRDVLAARGDDDLLLAAGDPHEAVVVDLAEVAGVEPAVRRAPPPWPSGC